MRLLRGTSAAASCHRQSPESKEWNQVQTDYCEIVGGSYDGTAFVTPEEAGGPEIVLPGRSARVSEFYRHDGRKWRFVGYVKKPGPVVRIAE